MALTALQDKIHGITFLSGKALSGNPVDYSSSEVQRPKNPDPGSVFFPRIQPELQGAGSVLLFSRSWLIPP